GNWVEVVEAFKENGHQFKIGERYEVFLSCRGTWPIGLNTPDADSIQTRRIREEDVAKLRKCSPPEPKKEPAKRLLKVGDRGTFTRDCYSLSVRYPKGATWEIDS